MQRSLKDLHEASTPRLSGGNIVLATPRAGTGGPSSEGVRCRAITFRVRRRSRWCVWRQYYLAVGHAAQPTFVTIESERGRSWSYDVREVHSVRMHDRRRLQLRVDGEAALYEFETAAHRDEAHAALSALCSTAPDALELHVATWNLGNRQPGPSERLRDWFPPGADVVAIGVQEASYSGGSVDSLFALLTAAAESGAADGGGCAGGVSNAAGTRFERVGAASMGQIHLLVLARRELVPFISAVETGVEATGVGGVGTNKGAVALALRVCNVHLGFVNAHLAAHQGMTAARNEQAAEINRNLRVGRRGAPMGLAHRFEHVLWLGDLNYRIDLPRADVDRHVAEGEWEALEGADQLRAQMRCGAAFGGWQEGPLRFAPTFKFLHSRRREPSSPLGRLSRMSRASRASGATDPSARRHSADGDEEAEEEGADDCADAGGGAARAYSQKRIPAWCDRVLWHSWPGAPPLDLRQYGAVPALTSSDHAPVFARFRLDTSAPASVQDQLRRGRGAGRQLVLTDLSASGLPAHDLNGLADPYLEVRASFGGDARRSSVRTRTLSPRWDGEALVLRVPRYHCSREHLRRVHIIIVIKDRDMITRDDTMGSAVLACAPAIDATASMPHAFALSVQSPGGRHVGTLSGALHVAHTGLAKRHFARAASVQRLFAGLAKATGDAADGGALLAGSGEPCSAPHPAAGVKNVNGSVVTDSDTVVGGPNDGADALQSLSV